MLIFINVVVSINFSRFRGTRGIQVQVQVQVPFENIKKYNLSLKFVNVKLFDR